MICNYKLGRELLVAALQSIVDVKPMRGFDHSSGLCHNVPMMLHETGSDQLQYAVEIWSVKCHHLFKSWPLYSGSISYPVPCPTSSCMSGVEESRSYAFHSLDKYEGDYGELRIDLIKHMIKCLEEMWLI